jgi:predicted Zn-dependent peptidase
MEKESIKLRNGTSIDRYVLDNGLKVLVEKLPEHNDCITLTTGINFAPIYENPKDNGIAHFIEHMLFKGTEEISRKELLDLIPNLGGYWTAYTNKGCTVSYIEISKKHTDTAIGLMADVLFNSTFGPNKINLERKVILQELRQDEFDERASDLFDETLFTKHPVRMPVIGTQDTIIAMERETLLEYYTRFYVPNNMIVYLVGDVDDDNINKLIGEFDKYPCKPVPKLEKIKEPKQNAKKIKFEERDSESAYVYLGMNLENKNGLLSHDHPDKFSMYAIEAILGGFKYNSRLMEEVREKKGLVYSIYANQQYFPGCTPFIVDFASEKKHVDNICKIIIDEINKLKTEKVSEEELEGIKKHIEGETLREIMNQTSRSGEMIKYEMCLGGIEKFKDFLPNIYKVTPDDVLRVANEYMDTENYTIAGILPRSD